MQEQGRKLMQTLAFVVANLNNLGEIVPNVQNLGTRHIQYGVKDEDYQTVGKALILTLKEGLGDDFTPETKEAWIEAYTILSKTMIDAANNHQTK